MRNLSKVKEYITKKDVEHNNLKIITKNFRDEFKKENPDLSETLFDENVHKFGGAIPIPSKFETFNIFKVRRKFKNVRIMKGTLDYLTNKDCSLVIKFPEDSYIYVPKGLGAPYITDSGVKVATNIQNSFDSLVKYYSEWLELDRNYSKGLEYSWIRAYNQLLTNISSFLMKKGGLFDRIVGCHWKFSVQAVIIPNPSLNLNEIEIPREALYKWISNDSFAENHGISKELSIKDRIREVLNGKAIRLMAGRWPMHDMSNLLSFKMKINKRHRYDIANRFCIGIHPAIANLMDADYDGDMMFIAVPETKKAIEDLPKMDVIKYICNNPSEFKPGKEINKYKMSEWSRNPIELMFQIKTIQRKSTNGLSISYKDLLDCEKSSYFNDMKINREKLKAFSMGVKKSYLFQTEPVNEIEGVTISEAIRDYRIIKTLVPKSGALSNALMVLAISKMKENGKSIDIVRRVAHAKHILCQDGLSAKHGTNIIDNADELYSAFYNPKETWNGSETDFRKILSNFDLPEEDINAIFEIFWSRDPESINKVLKEKSPHFLLTRRSADLGDLEDILLFMDKERSIQKDFIEFIIKQGAIDEVSGPCKIRQRKSKVRRNQLSTSFRESHIFGRTCHRAGQWEKKRESKVQSSYTS